MIIPATFKTRVSVCISLENVDTEIFDLVNVGDEVTFGGLVVGVIENIGEGVADTNLVLEITPVDDNETREEFLANAKYLKFIELHNSKISLAFNNTESVQ